MRSTCCVTLAVNAMATRFELVLYGHDPVRLRAAGEEALLEIERLEDQLSFYRPQSEISRINAGAAIKPVKIEPRLFRLLQECARFSEATGGAFDVTVGPLMRLWFQSNSADSPSAIEIEAAKSLVGMHNVELDENEFSVRFKRKGVAIDLGAYGKGYAIDRAVSLLRENGLESALLHGGTSSVCAIGSPAGDACWRVSLQQPLAENGKPMIIELIDASLSVSALRGRSVERGGKTYSHVIDPRGGLPVSDTLAAAVVGPSAAVCEAISTALLVLGCDWLPDMTQKFPSYRAVVARNELDRARVVTSGQISDTSGGVRPGPAPEGPCRGG